MRVLTVKELRKELRVYGFGLRVKSNSFGGSGEIYFGATDYTMPSVFSVSSALMWRPIIELIKDIQVIDHKNDVISGPWSRLRARSEEVVV